MITSAGMHWVNNSYRLERMRRSLTKEKREEKNKRMMAIGQLSFNVYTNTSFLLHVLFLFPDLCGDCSSHMLFPMLSMNCSQSALRSFPCTVGCAVGGAPGVDSTMPPMCGYFTLADSSIRIARRRLRVLSSAIERLRSTPMVRFSRAAMSVRMVEI